jgi:hypothetical protein
MKVEVKSPTLGDGALIDWVYSQIRCTSFSLQQPKFQSSRWSKVPASINEEELMSVIKKFSLMFLRWVMAAAAMPGLTTRLLN